MIVRRTNACYRTTGIAPKRTYRPSRIGSLKFPQFTGPFLLMLGTIDLNYLSFGSGGLCGYKSVRKSGGLGIGPDSHRSSSEQRVVSSDGFPKLAGVEQESHKNAFEWPTGSQR